MLTCIAKSKWKWLSLFLLLSFAQYGYAVSVTEMLQENPPFSD